jgi:hypothetical protein
MISKRNNIIGVLLFVLAMLVFNQLFVAAGQAGEAGKTKDADIQRLAGQWVRPDGGYILELSEIRTGGKLKARYFNPRPINVYQSEYRIRKGRIELFIELRDTNYPGSKYHLTYRPEADTFEGTYFQAMERQTYNITFERAK